MKNIGNSAWLILFIVILNINDGSQMLHYFEIANLQNANNWDVSSKYRLMEINHEVKVLHLTNADYERVSDELTLNMFKNLEYLNLSGNKLQEIPKAFEKQIPRLNILDLSTNLFTIWKCYDFPNLSRLNLSHNKIIHITSNAITCLPKIRSIHLEGNFLQILPSNLFNHNQFLSDLFISNNKFEIFPLIQSKSLELIDISQCKMKYIDFGHISDLPSLKFLNISLNEIRFLQNKNLIDTTIDVRSNPLNQIIFQGRLTEANTFKNEIRASANFLVKTSFEKEYENSDQEKTDVDSMQTSTSDIIATSIAAFMTGALFGGMFTALVCACANTKCCTSDNTLVVSAENENRNSNQMVIRIPLRMEDDPPSYQEALEMRRSFHSLPELSVNPLAEQLTPRLSRSTNDILAT